MKKILLFLSLILMFHNAFSATFTTISDGNALVPATWSPSGIPGPNDEIIIRHNVTLDLVDPYYHFNKITVETGAKLSVSNGFILGENAQLIVKGVLEILETSTADPFTIRPSASVTVIDGGKISVKNTNAVNSIVNEGTLNVTAGQIETSGNIVNRRDLYIGGASVVQVGSLDTPPTDADYVALTPPSDFSPSRTIIDGQLRIGDDIDIIGTNAFICGNAASGSIVIGQEPLFPEAPGSSINYSNGATSAQICPEFQTRIIREESPLPIDILSIHIRGNVLSWDVFEERIDGYDIQHSDDIETWTSITSMDSKGDGRHQYSQSLTEVGYYRLKVRSIEETKFSKILFFTGSGDFAFYPTILHSGGKLNFVGEKLIHRIELISTTGLVKKVDMDSGPTTINEAPGVYSIKILGKDSFIRSGKLVVR